MQSFATHLCGPVPARYAGPGLPCALTIRAYIELLGPVGAYIEPVGLANWISATVVKWGAAVEGTTQSIIDDAEGIQRAGKLINKLGEVETFLLEELKNGQSAPREMIELVRQLGIHPKTLERARE